MFGIASLDDYLRFDATSVARQFASRPHGEWLRAGEEHAVGLFHQAARRVPAYRKFLEHQGIEPGSVTTIEDFSRVPTTDKANYIDCFPLEERVWDGDLARAAMVNTSSGTAGRTYLWPTAPHEVAETATLYEHVCRTNLRIDSGSTLLVLCFGMGTWIAGAHTLAAAEQLHRKGYRLTIVTPGFDKTESLKILRSLSAKFDQTVVAGIPSFVKDLIQEWVAERPERRPLKALLAGEGFSEDWRQYLTHTLLAAPEAACVSSVLGSADAGIMAFETPATIALRQRANADAELRRALFGSERTPMLFNYVPEHRFFEAPQGELLVTASRGVPLLRYNIHDQAKLLSPSTAQAIAGSDEHSATTLPMVAVFGRGKFAATLYGVVIQVEQVQGVMVHADVASSLTGRFALETAYTTELDQQLELHAELAGQIESSSELTRRVARTFVDVMRRTSSEYSRLYSEYGPRVEPQVRLYRNGDPERFPQHQQRKMG